MFYLITADSDDEKSEENTFENEKNGVENPRLLDPHRVAVRVAHDCNQS